MESEMNLPVLSKRTDAFLEQITTSLKVPRNVLADDDSIRVAWSNLPRVLQRIPPELRGTQLARMCVAVATGLFDSAINYIWNTSINELRSKVRRFGLSVVSQILSRKFNEDALLDCKDAELIKLCLELNLISEDGFYYLDQCRDIRNNFSAAHPPIGEVDEHEFIAFANRCAKYALSATNNPVGVDIQELIDVIKRDKFNEGQAEAWIERIGKTHEPQRNLIVGMLHGIYCDPASQEGARVNSLTLSKMMLVGFTPTTESDLINRHYDYVARGDDKRRKASQLFFEKLGLMRLLTKSEIHNIISNACKRLMGVHQSYDNFYNEPPFAERLANLVVQGEVPETVKYELVEATITCAVGNPYGISNAAMKYYHKIIKSFKQAEIEIMMKLPDSKTIVGLRMKSYKRCKASFKDAVELLDSSSIPTSVKKTYQNWLKPKKD